MREHRRTLAADRAGRPGSPAASGRVAALAAVALVAALVTFVSFTRPAGADTTFSKALPGNQQFTVTGSQIVTGCNALDGPHNYTTVGFIADAGGPYTVATTIATSLSSLLDDTMLALYDTAFDPNDPAANNIGCDDDNGPGFLSSLTEPLTVGNTYVLVVTTFDAGITGDVGFTISDPITLEIVLSGPAVTGVGTDSATFTVDGSSDGTGYWVVLPAGTPAPNALQIRSTAISGACSGLADVADCGSGSISGSGPFTGSFGLTGLSPDTAYEVFATAENAVNTVAAPVSAAFTTTPLPTAGRGFVALNPLRLVDTRSVGPIPGGHTLEFEVAGQAPIPADATATVLNVTATGADDGGFVTVWPCGQPMPLASNLNPPPAVTVPNQVTVGIGAGGKVCAYTAATTHLVVDANGYYGPTGGQGLTALAPVRLVDSRLTGPLIGGEPRVLDVAGVGGTPADASAVALNVTVTDPVDGGYLTVYPCDEGRPLASNLNFAPGQTVANAVAAKVDGAGRVCVVSTATTHVVVDLDGAYHPGGDDVFTPILPRRVTDTRTAGPLGAFVPFAVTVTGGEVPADAAAVALNVTVTGPETEGYLTVWPCGSDQPPTSNLNFLAGQTVPNAVTTAVGVAGQVCLASAAATHVVVDVDGYHAPA
jgi:hypothetical protein